MPQLTNPILFYLLLSFLKYLTIMVDDLISKVHKILNFGYIRYKQNGILHMLDRNRRIKPHPERFQETEEEFDLVVTVEERVYDQVIECEFPLIHDWITYNASSLWFWWVQWKRTYTRKYEIRRKCLYCTSPTAYHSPKLDTCCSLQFLISLI